MAKFKNILQQKLQNKKVLGNQEVPPVFQKHCEHFLEQTRSTIIYSTVSNSCIFQVCLSPSKMEAYFNAFFTPDTPSVDVEDVYLVLHNAGINHGIHDKELSKHMSENKLTGTVIGVLIANGTAPVLGQPGVLTVIKRPYRADVPEDLTAFDWINKEEVIAEVKSPIPSIPGTNVLGENFNHGSVAPLNYKINHNIHSISSDEKQLLVATNSGHIVFDNNYLELKQDLDVIGDVTVNRGALIYDNSVKVLGEIADNVSITVGKDLNVTGIVAAADVQVSGHINITKGIFGKGTGRVYCQGEVHAKYINEADIECKGNVVSRKEILNSHIKSYGMLDCQMATIAGGEIFAYKGVHVDNIGSSLGVKNYIYCGIDPNLFKAKFILQPECDAIGEKLQRAKKQLSLVSAKQKDKATEIYESLKSEYESRLAEIESMTQQALPCDENVEVKIYKNIYSGTTIMIGLLKTEVKEHFAGPMKYFVRDGRIEVETLT